MDIKNNYVRLKNMVTILKMLENQQAQVIAYIIENTNEHYQFLGSYKEIQENVNCSSVTVMLTFRKLKENKLITELKKGIWYVNFLQNENLQYALDGTISEC